MTVFNHTDTISNNMSRLHFTQNDFNEIEIVAGLLKKIDKIDSEEALLLFDEMHKEQPFLLSVLLGYHFDVTPIELEEIIKVYFLIWLYFKKIQPGKRNLISETQFTIIQNRNIEMLKYTDGESNESDKLEIYGADIQHIKSKALLTAILFRWNERPTLQQMNITAKGAVLIGAKSFIECFEAVGNVLPFRT